MVERKLKTIFDSKTYTFNIKLEPLADSETSDSIFQEVTLAECENPTPIEQELIDKQTPLYCFSRQWIKGVENSDYVTLNHLNLLNSVRKYPGSYLASKLKLPHDQRFIPAY